MKSEFVSAIGFDEYTDAVNQIEKLDRKINKENRLITEKEAKQEIKLLIRLLEFENVNVEVQKNSNNTYWAKTKNNEYDCNIADDLLSDFEIISIDKTRKIKKQYISGQGFNHYLSIELDKKWFVDRINDYLNEMIKD